MNEKRLPPRRPRPRSVALAHSLALLLSRYPVRGRGVLLYIIRRLLVPEPDGPTLIRTRSGFELVVDATRDRGVERALYFDGAYEAGTLAVMQGSLRQGDNVIDVGANIGLMSLFAARCVGPGGRVYAFEPEPDTFERLRHHLLLNHADSVLPLNIALGSARGEAVIHSREQISLGSATLVEQKVGGGKTACVRVESLDDFCKSRNLENVRVIKIDVEGWELEVLRGGKVFLSRRDSPIVIVECSSLHPMHGGRTADIYSLLVSTNEYRVYRLKRGKDAPSPLVPIRSDRDLPGHDNLFCFLPGHFESLPSRLFARE